MTVIYTKNEQASWQTDFKWPDRCSFLYSDRLRDRAAGDHNLTCTITDQSKSTDNSNLAAECKFIPYEKLSQLSTPVLLYVPKNG